MTLMLFVTMKKLKTFLRKLHKPNCKNLLKYCKPDCYRKILCQF